MADGMFYKPMEYILQAHLMKILWTAYGKKDDSLQKKRKQALLMI